jgi:toxin ParE1/3/4
VTVKGDVRTVRLAAAAEMDFRNILEWTLTQFGEAQARSYAKTLASALEQLTRGPAMIGARARDDIAKGLFTLHVARRGRKGRHFLLFRVGKDEEKKVIDVLRILHDAMDLPRHVPPPSERE